MTDQVAIVLPRLSFREGSAFTATAYFRDRATAAASTPTNIKYRVDCLSTGTQLQDWTTVSPSTSASISITATHNTIQADANDYETRQLTVAADYGLATQAVETAQWTVGNVYGF